MIIQMIIHSFHFLPREYLSSSVYALVELEEQQFS